MRNSRLLLLFGVMIFITVACSSSDENTPNNPADVLNNTLSGLTAEEYARFEKIGQFTLTGENSLFEDIAYSPDGQTLAVGGTPVQLLNATTGEVIQTLPTSSEYVVFSPNGQRLVTSEYKGESEQGAILVWDLSTGAAIQTFDGLRPAISPNGRFVASAIGSGVYKKDILIWDIEANAQYKIITGQPDDIRALTFSSDSRFLLSSAGDQNLRLWDIEAGRQIRSMRIIRFVAFTNALSPDDKYAVGGGNDINIFDLETGELVHAIDDDGCRGNDVVYSRDGKFLIVASGYDNAVCIINAETGELVKKLDGNLEADAIWAVALSPDGRTIIATSQDYTVIRWGMPSN